MDKEEPKNNGNRWVLFVEGNTDMMVYNPLSVQSQKGENYQSQLKTKISKRKNNRLTLVFTICNLPLKLPM
ncbi:hypothetical protein BVRB_4g077410 [Beta vulgaris subsp. vulgaris]|nr:hypothetical protein BVRB_4g077410 [Beta vulgaris subsp. vulgaris]